MVPAALLLLVVPEYRAQLRRPGPYVGLLVFLAVLAPHLAWLVANDFPTFGYAMARGGGGGETGWADHVVNPLSFLGEVAGVALPASPLAGLADRFPGIEEQPPLTVPWSTGADLPPIEVGWAIVPPSP